MDDFKIFNDTYGHDTGDHILLRLVVLLKDHFGEELEIIRYGGDEFVVVFRNTVLETILSGIKAVRIKLSQHYKGADVSYGFINNENDILSSLLEADRRMYDMKKEKKGVASTT